MELLKKLVVFTLALRSPACMPDQAALHDLLERIGDLKLTLISVNTDGPSTQDSDTDE